MSSAINIKINTLYKLAHELPSELRELVKTTDICIINKKSSYVKTFYGIFGGTTDSPTVSSRSCDYSSGINPFSVLGSIYSGKSIKSSTSCRGNFPIIVKYKKDQTKQESIKLDFDGHGGTSGKNYVLAKERLVENLDDKYTRLSEVLNKIPRCD